MCVHMCMSMCTCMCTCAYMHVCALGCFVPIAFLCIMEMCFVVGSAHPMFVVEVHVPVLWLCMTKYVLFSVAMIEAT